MRWLVLPLLLVACYGPSPTDGGDDDDDVIDEPGEPLPLRIATFNVSLYGREPGDIADRLRNASNEQAAGVAAILQEVRPDVILINELDWDADGLAAQRLHDNYLAQPQGEREPLFYPYVYIATSNTGVASGQDLDGDGNTVLTPGSDAYGDDSFGFGRYEGQYGFVVYSAFELNTERTFQEFRWVDMPDNDIPPGFYSPDAEDVLRLSSKNHVDLPVLVGQTEVHFLVSHPTPPSFDGSEDRNGRRNHDEIRLWADYLDGGSSSYHYDDNGQSGALGGTQHFVVAGDLNADPNDGDSAFGAIDQLLSHPLVQDPRPSSLGGAEQAALQGEANDTHVGDPALDTTDFSDSSVGNLRIDYVLPSTGLEITGSGVFWPEASDPNFAYVGAFPFPVSDHRLVWVDVLVPQP